MCIKKVLLFFICLVFVVVLNSKMSLSRIENYSLQEKNVMFPGQSSIGVNIHTPLYGEKISSLGARWVRWGVDWKNTEKIESVYDFSENDLIINNFQKNGLKVLLGIDLYAYNSNYPAYNLDSDKHLKKLIKFTTILAKHYKDKISIWEIGNEPQLDPYHIFNRPEKYTAAAQAIAKAINQVDPKAHVAALSSAWMDKSFIEQCLKLGLLKDGTIDILSFHGYHRQNIMPESGLGKDIQWLREKIIENRPLNKKVIVIDSERGYAIQPFMTPKHWGSFRNIVYSEGEQAAYLARHYIEEMYLGIEVSIWYKDMWGERNFSLFEGGSDSRIRPMGRVMHHLSTILPNNPKEMINSEYDVSVFSTKELSNTDTSIIMRSFVVKSKDRNYPKKLIVALWNPVEAFNGKILQSRSRDGENYEEIWRNIKSSDRVQVPIRVMIKNLDRRVVNRSVIVNLLSEKNQKAIEAIALHQNKQFLTTEILKINPTPTILVFELDSNS
jgi:hypothetical protein